MVLALGFRVRSQAGVRFRQWANAQLKEFIIKGFVLDDERKSIQPAAYAGHNQDYMDNLQLSWDANHPYGRGPAGIAVTLKSGTFTISDLMSSDPDR